MKKLTIDRVLLVGTAVAAALLLAACQSPETDQAEDVVDTVEETMEPPMVAIATLEPLGDSGVEGRVVFTQGDVDLAIDVDVTGLTPGEHGFHVHEYGDCSAADGSSAGGHFNPGDHPHAGISDAASHAGDLGNLVADENGQATREFELSKITLREGATNILGRAVIVHEKADDLATQPTGAAGGRVACGVVMLEGGETEPVLAE
jgi:Cu-Zn family superoxide dismutase